MRVEPRLRQNVRNGRLLNYSAAFAAALLAAVAGGPAKAQSEPGTVASVCTGVSLPPSVVTGILNPVLTGIVDPTQSTLNALLAGTLTPPLDIDLSALLADAASGDPITLSAIAEDGSSIGPADECNATADSYTLDSPAGISIGGNAITGLGAEGERAVAGEIDSIALGNRASTDASAAGAVAIGPDASVGAGADGSIALGSGASASEANSVALGADSLAARGSASGYAAFGLGALQNSAGEISVGAAGAERQITNVAAGSAPTDAVNVAQLQAVAALIGANSVNYDDPSLTTVTMAGPGGTTITNVAAGEVSAASTDAVNGSQLHATNQQVSANTTAITNLTTIVNSGANSPAQYSDDTTPTQPNGGTPTNDVTLVGGSPGAVQLHNVAAGTDATDAVNLAQLQAVAALIGGSGGANAVTYNDSSLTTVTLAGASGTTINNLAAGEVSATSTDAVNGSQLYATNQQVSSNSTAITNLSMAIANGAVGPVQYSNDSSPTTPNGGVPTNDLTLVGGSSGPVQLHNVANGVIAAGSTDAVNGGQIHELALAVDNAVQYEVDSNGNRTNRVVLVGGNASAPVTIANVAAGVAATDAVNVGQLNSAVDNAVILANSYTDQRIEGVEFDLRKSRREARAGTAAALAAAGLPQSIEPGKGMIAVAVGGYHDRVALAVGASAVSNNGRTVMRLGATYDSSARVGANIGVGWHF